MERSTYFWYYDGTAAKAQQVADTGATIAYIKAGGDRGVAWIPDPTPEDFENEQWDEGYLHPLTSRGVRCLPWFYNWPVPEDQRVVGDALAVRWADCLVLNVETEWRVQHPTSPYNTLAQANVFAKAWVVTLKAQLLARFGRVPSIGYSACPSWADMPIEGFEAACDFSMPQHYWPDELMAPDGETGSEAGEDMVEAHLRRCGKAKPCIPILTACREYDDAGVIGLATNALGDYPDLAGFSAWEAGNRAYQADAMKEAYAMLPQDNLTTPTNPSPIITPETNWGEGSKGRVVHRAETILVINDEDYDPPKTFVGVKIDGNQLPFVEVK